MYVCMCVCERERESERQHELFGGLLGGRFEQVPRAAEAGEGKVDPRCYSAALVEGCWKRSVEAAYLLCVREREVEGRESGRRGLGRREKLTMTRGGRGRKRLRASAGSMCVCEGAKRLLERYLEWSLEHGSQLRAAVTPTFVCLCYFGREAPFQSQVHRLH